MEGVVSATNGVQNKVYKMVNLNQLLVDIVLLKSLRGFRGRGF